MKIATLSPTNYCNFDCSYCGSKKDNCAKSISLSEAKKFLNYCKKNKVRILHITGGGEPLLVFDKLLNIMHTAHKKGIHTHLNTNSSVLSDVNMAEYLIKLKSAGLKRITISIDQDHLKFIKYGLLIKIIKCSLDNNIRVWLKVINRKETKKKNYNLIKKIAKNLNGKLFGFSYKDRSQFFIKTRKDLIYVRFSSFAKTDATTQKMEKELVPLPIEKIVFSPCQEFRVTMDSTGYILPCCSFYSANNPKLYAIGDSKSLQNKKLNINNLLRGILFEKFGFVKLYLSIARNGKLKEELFKESFYDKCDFCFWIQSHKNEINKLSKPTTLEIIKFVVPKIGFYLENFIDNSVKNCINISATYIERIFYKFNR